MINRFFNKIVLFFLVITVPLFATGIDTPKYEHASGEQISVILSESAGNDDDWVGVYPLGSSNDWDNVVSWSFTNGIVNGNLTLDGVPAGDYEIRLFFSNSFNLEVVTAIKVLGGGGGGNGNISVTTSKDSYQSGEGIDVTLSNMGGNGDDWVGVYPVGASNDWANVASWAWTNGIVNGTVSLDGVPAGDYEVRAFLSNSFNVEATSTFSVNGNGGGGGNVPHPGRTVYENASNGLSNNWAKILGNYNPVNIHGVVKLTPEWINSLTNVSEYWLYINAYHTKLSLDIGGVGREGGHVGGIHKNASGGWMPHYFIGVRANTTFGIRSMIWDSWFNHNNWGPAINDYGNGNIELTFPSPTEFVGLINPSKHINLNLQQSLQSLEPGNSIIEILAFTASGGYVDNITLE